MEKFKVIDFHNGMQHQYTFILMEEYLSTIFSNIRKYYRWVNLSTGIVINKKFKTKEKALKWLIKNDFKYENK